MSEERRRALLPHVTRKHPRLGGPQVDDDEAVERVAELVVRVETEQPPPELQVLLEEDRNALAVVLDARDDARQLLDVLQVRDLDLVAELRTLDAERVPR